MEPPILANNHNELSKHAPTTLSQRMKEFTPMVIFMTLYLSLTAWNYGYDVSVFSGVQAMDPFIRRFGRYKADEGIYTIPSHIISIMNSFPYLGKLIGCWIATPFAERLGRKKAILVICLCSFMGTLLQITAGTVVQFTIGRMLCYGMTGICVIVIPAFMAECAPAIIRGMVTAQLQLQIAVAQLTAALINFRTSTIESESGWRISIGIQIIMPGLLLLLYPLVVESPRWLLSRGHSNAAAQSLRRLCKNNTSEDAIQHQMRLLNHSRSNDGQGTWREVITGTNGRRTRIALIVMIGQQLTGQAFISQYAILFYKQEGFNNAFQLGVIQQALGVSAVILTTFIVDSFGRRKILILGGIMTTSLLCIMGSIGTIDHPTHIQDRVMVSCVMLWFFFYLLSWAPVPYIVLGEVSSRRVVEKTNNLSVSFSVLSAFLVSFTVPYLTGEEYADLGGKVGFIYASLNVAFTVLTYFFVPEMKGLSLETLDVMFEKRISARHFLDEELCTTLAQDMGRIEDGGSGVMEKEKDQRV